MREFVLVLLICHSLFLLALGKSSEVCFDNLECFPVGPPWSTLLRIVPDPQGPETVKTNHYLYTRKNRNTPFIIYGHSNWSLNGSLYEPKRKTFIVFHGYGATVNASEIQMLKDGMLKGVDSNVFLVDFSSLKDQDYEQVVSNVRVVAALSAKFFRYLIETTGASPSDFHIIGVSLGAHVAKYLAKRIRVPRLTGLDPAQILFEWVSPEVRISKGDAEFVDVVHTNGNPTIPYLGMGISYADADVDFFVNGAWLQNGCTFELFKNIMKSLSQLNFNLFDDFYTYTMCPHLRSVNYFVEAFSNPNCTFWGERRRIINSLLSVSSGGWLAKFLTSLKKCDINNCIPLNFNTQDYPARGSFAVATSHAEPFCVKNTEVDKSMEKQLQEYRSKQVESKQDD